MKLVQPDATMLPAVPDIPVSLPEGGNTNNEADDLANLLCAKTLQVRVSTWFLTFSWLLTKLLG